MAELADALDSGSSESNFMQVQVLFPAPSLNEHFDTMLVLFFMFFEPVWAFLRVNGVKNGVESAFFPGIAGTQHFAGCFFLFQKAFAPE